MEFLAKVLTLEVPRPDMRWVKVSRSWRFGLWRFDCSNSFMLLDSSAFPWCRLSHSVIQWQRALLEILRCLLLPTYVMTFVVLGNCQQIHFLLSFCVLITSPIMTVLLYCCTHQLYVSCTVHISTVFTLNFLISNTFLHFVCVQFVYVICIARSSPLWQYFQSASLVILHSS